MNFLVTQLTLRGKVCVLGAISHFVSVFTHNVLIFIIYCFCVSFKRFMMTTPQYGISKSLFIKAILSLRTCIRSTARYANDLNPIEFDKDTKSES
uniref:Uncharacterized protein n=1 Tax=Tetranychus urticae TaxID=32264 RepID=T1KEA6_TETUR